MSALWSRSTPTGMRIVSDVRAASPPPPPLCHSKRLIVGVWGWRGGGDGVGWGHNAGAAVDALLHFSSSAFFFFRRTGTEF